MKGGAWVYATHDLADLSAVLDSIHKGLASGEAHPSVWHPCSNASLIYDNIFNACVRVVPLSLTG